MNENTNAEKLTREEKSRAMELARVLEKLPEREQEKILYIAQGISIATAIQSNTTTRTAAL